MAVIQNERDKILQAASVRFIAPEIDPGLIPGYEDALDDIAELQDAVSHALNSSKQFAIRASALTVTGASGTTTPASITLTAVRGPDLTGGSITWSVQTGTATVSPTTGESTSVAGSSITGSTATIRARLIVDSKVYDAYVTLTRLGAISAVDRVNLTNQVTGSLASGNVSGLGALALLNVVDLNTQTVGALNGLTQVTNLGALAYANAIAANQIGAGTLAAGVVYAGEINASQVTAGTFTGLTFQTTASSSGNRVLISQSTNDIQVWVGGTRAIWIGGGASAGVYAQATGFSPGVTGVSSAGAPGILGISAPGTVAVRGLVDSGSGTGVHGHSRSTSSSAHGIRGENDNSGSSGLVGAANGYDFYAEGNGNYGPFTGVHDALVSNDFDGEPGDILVDGDVIAIKGVSDAILTAALCSAVNESGAIGVLAFNAGPLADARPAAFIDGKDENGEPVMSQAWHDNKDAYHICGVNSVGEGLINVCGQNGNISKGDLIVCSDMPGKGMRQMAGGMPDDIVRSYTVARSRADVEFSSPDEVSLVPCIYLCG